MEPPKAAGPSSKLPDVSSELPPGFSSKPPEQQPKIVMKGGDASATANRVLVGAPRTTSPGVVSPNPGGAKQAPVTAIPPIPNDPKWKTVSDFFKQILPSSKELSSPDYLSDKLWAAGKAAGSALDAMLTPAGPLDPLNAVPNLPQLRNDIKAYLLEGGNLGGPEGTPGLKAPGKSASPPGASAAPIARAAGEKAVSDALGSSVTASRAPNEPSVSSRSSMQTPNVQGVQSPRQFRRAINDDAPGKYETDEPPKNFVSDERADKIINEMVARKEGRGAVENALNNSQPQSGSAAATPVGRLAEENIAKFEAENKAPAMKQRLQDGATAMKKYFSEQGEAKAILRKNLGKETRVGAQATQAMAQFKAFVGEMNIDEQIDLLKWLQNPQAKISKGLELSPQAKDFVSTFHDWMHTYQTKLEALPQTEKMNFRENFVTQLWRKPEGAMKYINEYGAKQGSGYFTKARVFDDYEAGIRAGFAPVTTNPVEIFSRYIENASRKIASYQSKNDAFEAGMMVYRTSKNAPDGWVKLESIKPVAGQDVYAPPGFARIFDNFASQAMKMNIPGTNIDVLDAAQRAANATTGLKLSVSGFHPALETMEGLFSGIANGITKMKNGRPITGLADVITSPKKPFTSFVHGRQVQQAYLDGTWGTPEMQRIVRAMTDANFDPMREGGLADEYRVSRLPGFIKGWQKGIPMSAGGPLKTALRAFETVMEPTFQYYVPFLKNQAMYDMLKTYMDAHPKLTDEEFAAYARKASDTVDSRFGEINKNNIFLNATAKKMAQTAAISWSFTLGQARQAMGFAWDAARVPSKIYSKIKGELPDTEEIWTDRMSYAVGIGLGTAFVDSVYQYIKTGKLPQSPQDLMKPQTGGTDPSTGQPERASLPNFANSYKSVWDNGIGDELYNKANPLWQTLVAMGSNKDFAGHEIRDPNDTTGKQLQQLGEYAYQNALQPIGLSNVENAKGGTNISSLERIFGLRAAGMKDTAPEQLDKIVSYKNAENWYEKRKSDVNQKRAQKGLKPLRISRHERSLLIERYMKNPQADPLQSYGGTQ